VIDFPASPTVGETFTAGGTTWTWDGVKWTFSAGAGAVVIVGAAPPSTPAAGALWWDTVGGQLYVWFNDGTSSQWVIAVNSGGGASISVGAAPPTSPAPGNLWWDAVGGQLYVWYVDANSAQWVPTTNQMGGNFLPLSGGALAGDLSIASADGNNLALTASGSNWPGIKFTIASGTGAWIGSYVGANERWEIDLGNGLAETGSNAGSNFQIARYSDAGAFLSDPLIINRQTGAVGIQGTNTNDNAVAAQVGEVISSNVTTGVPLTSAVGANITSILLTPGDWDVYGEVWAILGTGATAAQAGINTVSATIPTASALNTARTTVQSAITAASNQVMPLRSSRVSLAASTTYYLIANVTFSGGTSSATGNIIARRMR
jgi:hypothetical protein